MMRVLYRVSSYLLMILGFVHTVLTPVFYRTFSLDALWFAGSGLALIFLGLLNIAAERILEKWILNLSIAATFVGFVFVVAGFILLREIQAVIALIIFLDVLLGSISIRRKM